MYPDSSDMLTAASVRVMAAIENWLSHNASTHCITGRLFGKPDHTHGQVQTLVGI